MCDAKKCFFAAAVPGAARSASRRHRLWELPSNTHCPVIGVCLPLALLRRLINKGVRGQALADDDEIHVGAVAECGARKRVSNLLQEALDQRYGAVLLQFKPAVSDGDVAGAFWAALTHPCSDFLVQDSVLREMHMIQHQAGAGTRVDQARDSSLGFLQADFDAFKAAVPELDARQRLQERIDTATRRLAERDALVVQLREQLAAAARAGAAARA
jgi:hypothetical protein